MIKGVSAATAVPAPISERVARSADFLLGAALWLLDYWELHCGSEEEYLSLLPPEPDELLEYDIPFSEDLEHSRDVLLRTLMLLRGRDGAYRREFRALLELLQAMAKEKHATPAQISMAWMLCKKPYIVPIPGTRKLERLRENAGAAEVELSGAEMRILDRALDGMKLSQVFGGSPV